MESDMSKIILGPMDGVAKYLPSDSVVIITDNNVRKYYGEKFPNAEIIEIEAGEEIKTLKTVESIYQQLLSLEADRSWFVLGIGGGVVTDIAGFVASTYMRGIEFGFIPTTFLAQVDASIGGKNGVNLRGYKNIIGTIRQPKFILCDTGLLKTLPKNEIKNGFVEVIKHAAIGNAKLFSLLEKNHETALLLDDNIIKKIVHDSIKVKTTIVKKDETEKLERMKLNFGHTIGHAIEKITHVPHGEAIAVGMVAECKLFSSMGLVKSEDTGRLENLIKLYGLPTAIRCMKSDIAETIRKDKKRRNNNVILPVLNGIGKCRLVDIELNKLEAAINDMC
ncbi:3-dehydroquinate synthase [Candidatus Micrarchaeota archaeon]|nr:3-dehydroquinate synthase [Candidatus Micrarchaeota archaeon]MBU1166298.1 3-dehydroquinate synthase [Candidatus Micrarchaeota archaeon]MBU1886392.1 3-dehydroquinate synthase [Candidatus Micrarchaeota archaeon]